MNEEDKLNPESDESNPHAVYHKKQQSQQDPPKGVLKVTFNQTKEIEDFLAGSVHFLDYDKKKWLMSLLPKKVISTQRVTEFPPTRGHFAKALTNKKAVLILFFNNITKTLICCFTQAQMKFIPG
jgi:hypothetical protein